ncbi:unnamed protein product [Mucor hiemalis]
MVKFLLLSTIAAVFLRAVYGLDANQTISALTEGNIIPEVFDTFEPVAELKIIYDEDVEVGNGKTIAVESLGDAPQVLFQGSNTSEYTFLVANLDAKAPEQHILWLKSNINAGQNDGEDVTAYKSPVQPSGEKPQRLLYALFEQPTKNITTTSLNSSNIVKDLKQFVKDNHLTLVNAAYIYTQSGPEAIVTRLQRIANNFEKAGLLDSLVGTLDHLLDELENILGISVDINPTKKPKKSKKTKKAKKVVEPVDDEEDEVDNFDESAKQPTAASVVVTNDHKQHTLDRLLIIASMFDESDFLDSVFDVVNSILDEIDAMFSFESGSGDDALDKESGNGLGKNSASPDYRMQSETAAIANNLQQLAETVERATLLDPVIGAVMSLVDGINALIGLDFSTERKTDEEIGALFGGLSEQPVTNNRIATQDPNRIIAGRLEELAKTMERATLLDPVLGAVQGIVDEINALIGLDFSRERKHDDGDLFGGLSEQPVVQDVPAGNMDTPEAAAAVMNRLQQIAATIERAGLVDPVVDTVKSLLDQIDDLLLDLGLGSGSSDKNSVKTSERLSEQQSNSMTTTQDQIIGRLDGISKTVLLRAGLLDPIVGALLSLLNEITSIIGLDLSFERKNEGDLGSLFEGLSEQPVQAVAHDMDNATPDEATFVIVDGLQRIAKTVERVDPQDSVLDPVKDLLDQVDDTLGVEKLSSGTKSDNNMEDGQASSLSEQPVSVTAQDQVIDRLQRIAETVVVRAGLIDPVVDTVKDLLDRVGDLLGVNLRLVTGNKLEREDSLRQPLLVVNLRRNAARNFRRNARI